MREVSIARHRFQTHFPESYNEGSNSGRVSPEYLPLLGASLGLQRPGALLHTLPEAQLALVRRVVQVCQLSQRQDVVTGDS